MLKLKNVFKLVQAIAPDVLRAVGSKNVLLCTRGIFVLSWSIAWEWIPFRVSPILFIAPSFRLTAVSWVLFLSLDGVNIIIFLLGWAGRSKNESNASNNVPAVPQNANLLFLSTRYIGMQIAQHLGRTTLLFVLIRSYCFHASHGRHHVGRRCPDWPQGINKKLKGCN